MLNILFWKYSQVKNGSQTRFRSFYSAILARLYFYDEWEFTEDLFSSYITAIELFDIYRDFISYGLSGASHTDKTIR